MTAENTTDNKERRADPQDRVQALVTQPWYILGPPWATSDYAGTQILAGCEDPHLGIPVCDTYDLMDDRQSVEDARGVASHIVRLHNESLKAG